MAPSFSGRQVCMNIFHKKMWNSGSMPHWLRTQYWSVSIVTTGTVWTHSPLHPSCRVWGDRQCSNYLSNAGMNMFSTMHSSAVLPDDVTGRDHICTSLPILWPRLPFLPYHFYLTGLCSNSPKCLIPMPGPLHMPFLPPGLLFCLLSKLLSVLQVSGCPFHTLHQSKSPRFNLYFFFFVII